MCAAGIPSVGAFRFCSVNMDSSRRARPETGFVQGMPISSSRRIIRSLVRPLEARSAAYITAAAAALLLAGCNAPTFGAYRGATTQGHATFKLWQGSVIAALAVGALVLGLIMWAVFRYRKTSDEIPKQTQYHLPLEIAYTVIPLIIVAVLFYFTVVTENQVDALPPHPAAVVKITAFQWGWRFHYLGHHVVVEGNDVTGNVPELVLPVGQTVRVILVSNDVVHGFYVAAFDFSRYALPGVTNRFDLTVRHAGTYPGRCTQFCGLYHTEMLFTVKAVTPQQFQAWLISKAGDTRVRNTVTTGSHNATASGVGQAHLPRTKTSAGAWRWVCLRSCAAASAHLPRTKTSAGAVSVQPARVRKAA